MAKKVVKKKVKKVAKKSFFEVEAPLTSANIQLYAPSVESLNNKTVKIDLTKNLRGKSLILKMRVLEDKGKLKATPEEVELVMSYVRRSMRKGVDYCEDSFEVQCKDKRVRIKPLLITRNRVSRAVLRTLRENSRKFLEGYLKTRSSEEIFSEIITNKLQKQMSLKLKKVYPLALCEIRVFKVVDGENDG